MQSGSAYQPDGNGDGDGTSVWLTEEITALRDALRRHAPTGGSDDGHHLRAILSPMAAKSRGNGLDATDLVVQFKQAWYALPEVSALPRHTGQRILDRAITLLIEEYYR
jgi:hypothetical protein